MRAPSIMAVITVMTVLVGATAYATDAAPTGRMAVALTAPGASGAAYRFVPVEVPPGDAFAMTRIVADDTQTAVEAILEPSAPIIVVEGQTTPLTLRFHVVLTEDIAFAMGAVQIDVAVNEAAATSYQTELAGDLLRTIASTLTDAAPPSSPTGCPPSTAPERGPDLHTTGS